ncbi:MAG: nicotinate-nucleotide adenylyltransferase [Rhodospirillales bacterium]|jgi:nicotinate-nucleotide adenylyltransferase|nr:nicotinate-nucleotide adenylyltransferase [Rhodospirillales bacterium]
MIRIGLLGGSFNPAHEGHRHISLEALKRLRLREVWWLVSPQNPLKTTAGMASMAARMAAAERVAGDLRIRVTDIESRLRSTYTVDTLHAMTLRFPRVRFVWIMGADNLIQISRWKHWQEIFRLVPVAVFARPPYSTRALSAKAARYFAGARVPEDQAGWLADRRPPAWIFLHVRPNPQSATSIRAGGGWREREDHG